MRLISFPGSINESSKSSTMSKSISPLIYISKIFGLAPFTVPPNKSSLKNRIVDILIFLLIEILHLCLLYFNIHNSQSAPANDTYVFNISSKAAFFLIDISSIISIFLTMIHREKIHKIFEIINDCDEKLLAIGAELDFNNHFIFTLIYVIMSCTANLLIEMFIVFERYVKDDSEHLDLVLFFTFFILHFVNWIVMSQYLFMIFAVKTRFEEFNVIFR